MKHFSLIILIALFGLFLASCAPSTPAGMISPADYISQYQSSGTTHLLLDVRTPEEFADGHIAGAINIPLAELENQLSLIPRDIPVIVYCRSGNRSAQAASLLRDSGYTQIHDMGGIVDWVDAGYPVE